MIPVVATAIQMQRRQPLRRKGHRLRAAVSREQNQALFGWPQRQMGHQRRADPEPRREYFPVEERARIRPTARRSTLVGMGAPVVDGHSVDFTGDIPQQNWMLDDCARGNCNGVLDHRGSRNAGSAHQLAASDPPRQPAQRQSRLELRRRHPLRRWRHLHQLQDDERAYLDPAAARRLGHHECRRRSGSRWRSRAAVLPAVPVRHFQPDRCADRVPRQRHRPL